MINISGIEAGYVIDHIACGKWRLVYDMLQLDKVEGQVAIITHANSSKYGKKDIIKVEGLTQSPLHHQRRARLKAGLCAA